METLIITNNPFVAEKHEHVLFLDGSIEEVLIKVRSLVHDGYELISHPLPASFRMMLTPFRSVVLGRRLEKVDPLCVEIIEESIIKYKKYMDFHSEDHFHGQYNEEIDQTLLEFTLQENSTNKILESTPCE